MLNNLIKMKSKQLLNGLRYFANNYVLPIAVLLLVIVGCNELPNKQKQPELKPSNFKAPIVDTIAVAVDSNAYIINTK